MYKGKRFLALIPARAGSKGIPFKNLRKVCGMPLVGHAVSAARKSGIFDSIVVTTDSKKIAKIGREYGAETPFVRPAHLATSKAEGIDVVIHAVRWCEKKKMGFDYLVLLQPTSPLRTSNDILAAVKLCCSRNADSVISVTECEHHPLKSAVLVKGLSMRRFGGIANRNRQELPKYYRLNGAVYVLKWEAFSKQEQWFSSKAYAYIMPKSRSIDIDTNEDLILAELLLRRGANRAA